MTAPAHPETDPASALAELLCFDLYAASRAVTARYRPLLAELGITYPQYLVLVLLGDGSTLSVKQVAESLRLDHGTLTPLLRRLESGGLLTRRRSTVDERLVEVALTDEGVRVHARFDEVQCTIRDAIGLTATQAREMQVSLRALRDAVDR